jgi:hypothetical protein
MFRKFDFLISNILSKSLSKSLSKILSKILANAHVYSVHAVCALFIMLIPMWYRQLAGCWYTVGPWSAQLGAVRLCQLRRLSEECSAKVPAREPARSAHFHRRLIEPTVAAGSPSPGCTFLEISKSKCKIPAKYQSTKRSQIIKVYPDFAHFLKFSENWCEGFLHDNVDKFSAAERETCRKVAKFSQKSASLQPIFW